MKFTKELWDAKAKNFPRFKKDNEEVIEVLSFFENNGVDFKDKNVLDLGCGTGRYALELANRAKMVYAADISDEMLRILNKDAKNFNINNVKSILCTWDELDTSPLNLDIIFASLTPALYSKESFLKALNLNIKSFCYIGWGRFKKSDFLEELLNLHNLALKTPLGLSKVLTWLEEENIKEPKIEYVTKTHTKTKDFDEMFKSMSWHVEANGGVPNEKIIHDFLKKYEKNGEISYSEHREFGYALITK
ncbi:class I SAM-dependent methyltransferase [Campylobacter sp. LR196d]|uniref:class I SAM-dependent methyltransferase n=1 Tax=Campylobacter sp. LR196d TaxID=2593543 RepID=UPI0012386699|nr:class I SAM-dependent methyltransferase [Campylobacter sp. LR196d]KAA6226833.1 class I SAM-dependent methyltransferase [Campylobacter sp. LR196d]